MREKQGLNPFLASGLLNGDVVVSAFLTSLKSKEVGFVMTTSQP